MEDIKAFQIRMPRNMWKYFRIESMDQEKSMNVIIIDILEKYLKKTKKEVDDK